MKVAIYIEDGLTQLVLSPESDFEKGVISKVEKGEQDVKIYTGGFYYCQGGWVRQREARQGYGSPDDGSLIIVMGIKEAINE